VTKKKKKKKHTSPFGNILFYFFHFVFTFHNKNISKQFKTTKYSKLFKY
jgi:hypothetical protein